MCGIWFLVGFLVFPSPSCSNSDNLALLLDTLKVVQRAVCNDEIVSLACPRGTTISIQVAQYGKITADLACSEPFKNEENKQCKRPNSMQYSLLQTVVEACQKKPQCKFSTLPRPGVVDPCPEQIKYIEVAYKCRPYEFRSRTGCEDELVRLSCNPHSRIAIFDAQYGRTAFEAVTCPQTQGVPDETCAAPLAVKTVMQLCLGKRRCMIAANNRTFSSSCKKISRPYLKVVYACVPFGVLSGKYESPLEKDEVTGVFVQGEGYFDETEENDERYKEPNVDHAIQPSFFEDIDDSQTLDEDEEMSTVDPKKTGDRTETSTEQRRGFSMLFLYVSIGVTIFIILIGILIGVRCYISKKMKDNSKNGDMYTTEAPNIFNDAFSDIDNDTEINVISGTFVESQHPDMILYKNIPGSRTLRAMRPLCTIYPSSVESNMYGNVDYVPPVTRDQVEPPRFTRSRSNDEGVDPNAMTSPRSLGAHSSNYFYG